MRNHEDEKEAIRILESVFPELKNCKFEKLDRPDLQSKTQEAFFILTNIKDD